MTVVELRHRDDFLFRTRSIDETSCLYRQPGEPADPRLAAE
ncbi:hypothetical protein EPYR_02602 [Erwinia pyrifoliae DSM 12163]|nr:hypothetical protein EPYR_02602 [Erwinia pyrifoliae DSM 12163]